MPPVGWMPNKAGTMGPMAAQALKNGPVGFNASPPQTPLGGAQTPPKAPVSMQTGGPGGAAGPPKGVGMQTGGPGGAAGAPKGVSLGQSPPQTPVNMQQTPASSANIPLAGRNDIERPQATPAPQQPQPSAQAQTQQVENRTQPQQTDPTEELNKFNKYRADLVAAQNRGQPQVYGDPPQRDAQQPQPPLTPPTSEGGGFAMGAPPLPPAAPSAAPVGGLPMAGLEGAGMSGVPTQFQGSVQGVNPNLGRRLPSSPMQGLASAGRKLY